MNPKISILIPVYNASQYIEKCARSIFNQTFEDIEFIFVNDATPDDSIEKLLKVIEEFPTRKEAVKILTHSKNLGSGASKNTAIESSKGEYITFVDSDDFIDSDMIEVLYNKAIHEQADIVLSNIYFEYTNKSIIQCDYISENIENYFRDMVISEKCYSFFCSKLIRRSLYLKTECRLPEGLNYLEDRHVMTRMFYYTKKIVKVDQAFYHYVQYNSNSITKTKKRMHFENVVHFWSLLDSFLKDNNKYEDLKSITEKSKIENKIRLMIDTHSSQLRKEYYDMFRDIEMKYLSHFRKGEILMLLLVRYKLFGMAQLFHIFLVFKNKKLSK